MLVTATTVGVVTLTSIAAYYFFKRRGFKLSGPSKAVAQKVVLIAARKYKHMCFRREKSLWRIPRKSMR